MREGRVSTGSFLWLCIKGRYSAPGSVASVVTSLLNDVLAELLVRLKLRWFSQPIGTLNDDRSQYVDLHDKLRNGN